MTDLALEGARARARVHSLVQERLPEARTLALSIVHPWYRCQAITEVAANSERPEELQRLLEDALEAAAQNPEPNRAVSVSAWPLSFLVHTDPQLARWHIERLLRVISAEPLGVRRADALLMIIYAIYPDRRLRELVLVPLREAIKASVGSKVPRIVRDLALVLALDDPEMAEQVLTTVAESQKIRQARRLIAAGERLGPRLRLPGHERPPSRAA